MTDSKQATPGAPTANPVTNNCVYISFIAEVNQITTESLLSVLAQQISKGIKEVHLLLSTPGGGVSNGLTLYNELKGMPFKLITHNVGNVNSIGNMIFLAGEERYACATSSFMFHGVGFDIKAQTRLEEKSLTEKLTSLQNDQKLIADVIGERTNIDPKEIKSLFFMAVMKDPTYAKKHGIIHDIREVDIPDGIPLLQLVFQR